MRFLRFLGYNNAVPIAISLVLLGGASTFAATNPDAILSSKQTVVSVDNTYLVNKDLSTYSPKIEIMGVNEDDQNYYVKYTFSTIDLQNYVWQDVTRAATMKISKDDLGPYRDLGVYVTVQLKQIISGEIARLTETQKSARQNVSHEVVSTQYSGLVGKFLDSTTEELPGYTPVVTPPENSQVASAAGAESSSASTNGGGVNSSAAASGGSSSGSAPSSSGILQRLGNNPAQIPIGTNYADLGVVVTSTDFDALDVYTYVNGRQVPAVAIDTSKVAQYTIRYEIPKANSSIERTVIVYDPNAQVSAPSTAASTSTTSPTDSTSTAAELTTATTTVQ